MKILDSNILIYAPQPIYAYLRPLLVDTSCLVSDFTRLEVLGYTGFSEEEKKWFESVFRQLTRIPVNEDILNQAIVLRQRKRMSPGDAIIAATALLYGFELYTRNIRDFSHIPELVLVNPVDNPI
ncbi:MAG: type II toxin-antitoxin system VapC family toxin [Bacteroidia bacterium]|nr:type II toxin-antitoxin system VapC family toxin [Bacteroidia bacterium]